MRQELTNEQKRYRTIKRKIAELKCNLRKTDYQSLKHADGALTDVEYEPIRVQRQAWRDEINALEKELLVLRTQQSEV